MTQAPRIGFNLRVVRATRLIPDRLFRAGDVTAISAAGAAELTDRRGVRAVLDLRSADEVARYGSPDTLIASGVRWMRTPICDYPRDVGHSPRPTSEQYVRYYHAILTGSAPQCFPRLFAAVSEVADEPFLVTCHGGKDRTGVVAAVLLDLVGATDKEIARDYAAGMADLRAQVDRFRDKWIKHGHTRKDYLVHLETQPVTMRTWLTEIRRDHGSVRTALNLRGVDHADLNRVAMLLRVGQAEQVMATTATKLLMRRPHDPG